MSILVITDQSPNNVEINNNQTTVTISNLQGPQGASSVPIVDGENYLSVSGNVITANPVNLSNTNVTGTIADARLGNVNANVGTFTNSTVTVDAKGRVTAASSGAGGSAAGLDGQVQYNRAGVTDGADGIFYDQPTNRTGFGTVTPSSTVDITVDGFGATATAGIGLALDNNALATASVVQSSPPITHMGSGWNSTLGASQTLAFRNYLVPAIGTSTGGTMLWQSSANGGAYTTLASLNTAGLFSTPALQAAGYITQTTATANLFIPGGTQPVATTAATFQYGTSSTDLIRVGIGGTSTGTVANGQYYSSFHVGKLSFTTAASAVVPWASNAVINNLGTITIGSGSTITNTTALYVGPASTQGTNNYSLYAAGNSFIAGTLTASNFSGTFNGVTLTTAGSATQYLNASGTYTSVAAGGTGTVTSVSVTSGNGFAGTVATNTTTPAITLSTTVTGILQGNGTAISAATTTGTGSVVLNTSPTLVTPALGTPSSATLTNATGLPISTGVSGLATGIAAFLATPTSANLATAVTNETGSGSLVFGTSPTITGATLTTTSVNGVTLATGGSSALVLNQAGAYAAVPVPAGVPSLVQTINITAGAATVDVINLAANIDYEFEFINVFGSASANIACFVSTNNGTSYINTAAAYAYYIWGNVSGALGATNTFMIASIGGIGTTTDDSYAGTIKIYQPNNAAQKTRLFATGGVSNSTAQQFMTSNARRAVAEANNAIRFQFDSGTFQGGIIQVWKKG